MRQKQGGATYTAAVNRLEFGSAIARGATRRRRDVAAKPVHSYTLVHSDHAVFCPCARTHVNEPMGLWEVRRWLEQLY